MSAALLALAALGAGPIVREVPVAVHVIGADPGIVTTLAAEIAPRTPLVLSAAPALGVAPEAVARCAAADFEFGCWSRLADGVAGFFLLVTAQGESAIAILVPASPEGAREDELAAGAIVFEAPIRRTDPWLDYARRFADKLAREGDRLRPGVGALLVRGARAGVEVAIDGEPVGALGPLGTLRIEHVRAGSRRLELRDPEGELRHDPELTLVRTGTVTVVEVALQARDTRVARYGGIGLAAAGAAILAYGLAAPRNRELCLDLCEGARFVSFGEGAGSRSGVLIAPLGYSLAIAGAAWALSPLAIDETALHPWLELGLALALGAASYAVSAAVGG